MKNCIVQWKIITNKDQVLKLLTYAIEILFLKEVVFSRDCLSAHCYFSLYSNGAEMVTIDDYFTNKNVGDFASVRNTNKFWTGKYIINRLGILLKTPRT